MDNVNFVIEPTLDEKKIFLCTQQCKQCKGSCCERTGCVYSPEDFYVFRNEFSEEERVRYLISFLKRGYTSIDHLALHNRLGGAYDVPMNELGLSIGRLKRLISYEKILKGDGVLYLRARNKWAGIIDTIHLNPYAYYTCKNLTKKGCKLPFNKRPKGGRFLRPKLNEDGECIPVYSEVQAAMEWFPHREVLYKVYQYFVE